MTTAQTVADIFHNDGTVWTISVTSLRVVALVDFRGFLEYEGDRFDVWRIYFEDGSALTGNDNVWDIEGDEPFQYGRSIEHQSQGRLN